MNDMIDTSPLDGMIVGRVEPQIYAFTTETIPNYLKVGDTYRPVSVRLSEWERIFPHLKYLYTHTAMLESGRLFRDYAVHQFLEETKGFHRLMPTDIPEGVYYSREFFKDAKAQDIDEAIGDIQQSEKDADGRYALYTSDHLPAHLTYKRDQSFAPRENQQAAIDRFKAAVANGRTNLLMYAVMRFGKSFTAMCCATEIDAPFVVVVSAKADVRREWKRTVESHVRFDGYSFYDGDDLVRNNHIVSETLGEGGKVVLFLTLQDLQGKTVKEKHEEIFKCDIDLLLIDETHFGARAEKYGEVLQQMKLKANEAKKELRDADTCDAVVEELKLLRAKVRLHLSGTPYRILMGGEFKEEDIVAFCQYADIVEAKDKWDEENGAADGVNEWDNPYYGFPQMVRFAFSPNASSVKRMAELKSQGETYAFSALFKPVSFVKDAKGAHKHFQHEREIIELLEVIDGSRSDENLLGFLDYDKLKRGEMCRHIVCVLPFRASCDAFEQLLKRHKKHFKNLSAYTIINISGVDNERKYRDTEAVKRAVKDCESRGEKTVTLTVNRMLTGSTVEEWDTMLYFKDTASPQEYDQATFRIQNQYVKTYVDANGNTVRYNMKPQTLLVDFDPNRMFRLQEEKARVYNAITKEKGNARVYEYIERELNVSPMVSINHGLLQRVTATNVMDAVREYSRDRGLREEAASTPQDEDVLKDKGIRDDISEFPEIDGGRGVMPIPKDGQGVTTTKQDEPSSHATDTPATKGKGIDWRKKMSCYFMHILLYVFLADGQIRDLEEVFKSMEDDNGENLRLAKLLHLKAATLRKIHTLINPFVLYGWDYKIANVNTLKHDKSLTPLQRGLQALKSIPRLSDDEVVTPPLIANELLAMLPDDALKLGGVALDIASVHGELACSIYQKYGVDVARRVYAVPTSPLTRELTRKIYGFMGLPTDHVLDICTQDLLDEAKNEQVKACLPKGVGLVIGVPTLGVKRGGGRDDGREAVYQLYYFYVRDVISPRYIALMTQSTWYSGGRGERLEEFRNDMMDGGHIKELHDYPDIQEYTKNNATTLRGGVCLFLWQKDYKGDALVVNKINQRDYAQVRPMRYERNGVKADWFIRWNKGLDILDKVLARETSFIADDGLMYHRNPFGFPDTKDNFAKRRSKKNTIKVYLAKQKVGYAATVARNPDGLLDRWKVLVAKASSGGDTLPHRVISAPIVSEPGSATANTHYVILPGKGETTELQAQNLVAYMRTRFFRFMVMLLRSNQNMRVDMYRYAPRLDFNRAWTDGQLYERYAIDAEEQKYIEDIVQEFGKKRNRDAKAHKI